MDFRELRLEDRQCLEKSLQSAGIINCDLTFANLYCWNHSYHSEIAYPRDGSIVIRYRYDEKEYTYTIIAPRESYTRLFASVEQYAINNGDNVRYYSLDKEGLKHLRSIRPEIGLHFHRERSEYLYRREDLAGLHGGHLKAKRNHLNRFCSTYSFSYTPLSQSDAPECLELLQIWNGEHHSDGNFAKCEIEKEKESIKTALENFDSLGLIGGAIRIDGRLAAFCYGSTLSQDTFCVHIEKADMRYEGIFVAIAQQFAEHLPSDYTYIDREDDLGIPGLRYSKESYHPCRMIHKFIAEPMTPLMTEIRRLWLSCFTDDSPEDAEQFLMTKFSPDNMIYIKDGEHISSMMHLIPFNDKVYCFAVATAPEHRRKGYATKLFGDAVNRCRERGYSEIVLIPSDSKLAEWYRRLGCYGDFQVRFNSSEIADPFCPDGCCLGTGNIDTDRALVYPLSEFRHNPGDQILLF